MSITTYAELQTAVGNWLKRADLSSNIPDLITLGEQRLYNDLRVKAMETSLASTITGSGVIAVPSDYVELKHAYIASSSSSVKVQWLDRKSAKWIYQNYPVRQSQSKPQFMAREGSNFIFGPYPDSTTYIVNGIYWARLSSISSAVNDIFSNYPGIYLFAALAEAAPFIKDDKRLPMWEAKYSQLKDMVQRESDDEESSGSDLRMTNA